MDMEERAPAVRTHRFFMDNGIRERAGFLSKLFRALPSTLRQIDSGCYHSRRTKPGQYSSDRWRVVTPCGQFSIADKCSRKKPADLRSRGWSSYPPSSGNNAKIVTACARGSDEADTRLGRAAWVAFANIFGQARITVVGRVLVSCAAKRVVVLRSSRMEPCFGSTE